MVESSTTDTLINGAYPQRETPIRKKKTPHGFSHPTVPDFPLSQYIVITISVCPKLDSLLVDSIEMTG